MASKVTVKGLFSNSINKNLYYPKRHLLLKWHQDSQLLPLKEDYIHLCWFGRWAWQAVLHLLHSLPPSKLRRDSMAPVPLNGAHFHFLGLELCAIFPPRQHHLPATQGKIRHFLKKNEIRGRRIFHSNWIKTRNHSIPDEFWEVIHYQKWKRCNTSPH